MKLSLMLPRIILALLLLLSSAASAQKLDKIVSAVVRISGTRGETPVRGTGFVVVLDRNRATVVTASHVIEKTQQLKVTFAADLTKSFPVEAILGRESGNPRGLAVLRVRDAIPAQVTTLSFDPEVQLQRGEELFLLGFPQMAMEPLTLRRIFAGPAGTFLQLDLPVGEGFSGAPVLRKGKVVGVVMEEDLQFTFAVKAAVAQGAVFGWGVKLGGRRSAPVSSPPTQARSAPPALETCVPGKERIEAGIVFVRICAGSFTMGSAGKDPQTYADEKPAHKVTLKSEFWIGKTEITNEQYRRYRASHKGKIGLPATNVTWNDAKAACESFGGRLPTEAEWEYAARAGTQTHWSFGNDERVLGAFAWHDENSGNSPHPVGTKKPSAWGLRDMHGNVWEWMADWFGPYAGVAQTDPAGPTTGEDRVLRGGSFLNGAWLLRSASRFKGAPSTRYPYVGFRCARSSIPQS